MVIVIVTIAVTLVLRRAAGLCGFLHARCTAEIRQLQVLPNKAFKTVFAGETKIFERFQSAGAVAAQKRKCPKLCMLAGRGWNVAQATHIAW